MKQPKLCWEIAVADLDGNACCLQAHPGMALLQVVRLQRISHANYIGCIGKLSAT